MLKSERNRNNILKKEFNISKTTKDWNRLESQANKNYQEVIGKVSVKEHKF